MPSKRMLMVNDDMVDMESLPFMFRRHGVDLVIVASVEEALDEFKKSKFDLIMTDISLKGGRTGIDLIKEIRKTDKQTLLAVATGYGDEYKNQAMAVGANYYFEKPLDFEEYIFKPLGVGRVSSQEEKKIMPIKDSNFTLRKANHEISNRNNLVIMVSGLLKEAAQNFINEKKPSQEIVEFLQRVADDAGDIEEAGKNADNLLKKIRESVYNKVNPDELTVE